MKHWNTKKFVVLSLLAALALVIYVAEAQLPPLLPVPGIKLGLANAVSLMAMLLYGKREGAVVLGLRIALGTVLTGQAMSFLYSLAGGVCCWAVMCVSMLWLEENHAWAVSALGAVAHNIAQVVLAAFIVQTPTLLLYAPVLILCALFTGVFTGLCAMISVKHIRKIAK